MTVWSGVGNELESRRIGNRGGSKTFTMFLLIVFPINVLPIENIKNRKKIFKFFLILGQNISPSCVEQIKFSSNDSPSSP